MQLIINNKPTKYEIYEDGHIVNTISKNVLKGTVYNTGYRFVTLNTEEGKKGYAVHRLVAMSFIPNPNNLPVVNHKDGNKLNNHVTNLEWTTHQENRDHAVKNQLSSLAYGKRNIREDIHEDGINWKRYQDTNYLISKKGQIFNTKTNIMLKLVPKTSGYIRVTLRINNKSVSKLAHRLVVETWIQQDIPSDMVINHIDGDKTNNNVDNLEIISKRENSLHFLYDLNKNTKPIILINVETLEEKIFPSMVKAAEYLNVSDGTIRYTINESITHICKGYYVKYK